MERNASPALNEKFVSLTAEDILLLKKIVRPIEILLLVITGIFSLFFGIVVFNLPYFWVIIGVSVFPIIPLAVFLYLLIITRMDINAGKLRLIQGVVNKKDTEESNFNSNLSIKSQMDLQTYYYIFVGRKKIEVDENQYNSLTIGDRVEVTVTWYSKRLLSLHKYPNIINLLNGLK